ncbi:hypothetical protein GCM10009801_48590 [Streptomyces albiaxialis]|uniref:DUF6745 domain-containing protein n=1 Tax=Streptomyces albiaxialis TaxID=329523 RepID=A0ABN2W860_9ACTN
MSGATRPGSRGTDASLHSFPSPERLRRVRALRDEWLGHGLAALPADRQRAEDAVAELYRFIGAPPPTCEWVDSPAAARELLAGGRTADGAAWRLSDGWDRPTVAGRLASLMSGLRARLDRWTDGHPRLWSGSPVREAARALDSGGDPEAAREAGVTLETYIDTVVRESLETTLRDALCGPMRTALLGDAGPVIGLTWYGQQDSAWIGPYDIRRRTGLLSYRPRDERQLDLWAALARSAGWWWPSERRCLLAERPVDVRTEPLPYARHGELRPHRDDGPAVRFPDGTAVHALHGTPVPEWVVTDPTVERVHAETNVEVRRCAIERIGWETYVRRAGLVLVSAAPDPGNPGSELRLYHVPRQVQGTPARVLLAVNGSVEPDGRRRRYGLSVPPYFDDPVAAAGWSYGLSGRAYAGLVRRT